MEILTKHLYKSQLKSHEHLNDNPLGIHKSLSVKTQF